MGHLSVFRKTTLWIVPLLITGCAGITPYDPPDYREEPPGQGLLSGEEGEFVVYRKNAEADTESESSKSSKE